MRAKIRVIIVGILLVVFAAIGTYAAVIPVLLSRQYTARVDRAARVLERDFKALDKSTELPLITDSSASSETKKKNAAYIAQLIDGARQKIAVLKKEDNSLVPLPYSNIFGQYNKALVLHDHTQRFLGQTEEALNDYGQLTLYLETYNNAVDDVTSRLNDFSKVSDLNEYEGQSDAVRQIADAIRKDADKLSKARLPVGVDEMSTSTIAVFNAVADGFDGMADGLALPADGPIYEAARKIEGATSDLDKIIGADYNGRLNQSRTIKNIQDFSEKLDLVLET